MSYSLSPRRPVHSGFTLIELLVVIAIIAILAAILFPVFAKAREKARQSSCASNLKQVGLGVMQYAQDYDERMPHQSYYSGNNEWSGTPAWQIDPYLKSKQIWVCPSKAAAAPVGPPPAYGGLSYGFNFLKVFGNNGRSMADFNQTASLIMITDSYDAFLEGWWCENSYPQNQTYNSGSNNRVVTQPGKHTGTVNVVFVDGHVKNYRPSRLRWGMFTDIHEASTTPACSVNAGALWDTPMAPADWDEKVAP